MSSWKTLTEAVERKTGCAGVRIRPGVAVCLPTGRGSATLPLRVAHKIAALEAERFDVSARAPMRINEMTMNERPVDLPLGLVPERDAFPIRCVTWRST